MRGRRRKKTKDRPGQKSRGRVEETGADKRREVR